MNEHELDLTLGAIVLSRTQVTAPPILREHVRAVPFQTPVQRSWLPQSPKWRFQSMFSATKLVVATAIVALFGGFLLAGVLTTQSDDLGPLAGGSPSPAATPAPAIELPAQIPDGVESGTLETPLGPARWVHLRGNADTLPTGLWNVVPDPAGGYTMLDTDSEPTRLWRSPDLMSWTSEPAPLRFDRGSLSLIDGSYWLMTGGPDSGRLARSSNMIDWTDIDLGGLTSPFPEGYLWVRYLTPPLVHDGTTIVPLSYDPAISGTSLGLEISGDPGVGLTEVEPGVYRAKSYHRGEGGTVRFVETGSGLQVIDHETGNQLAFLEGASMDYVESWASLTGNETVHRLAILDGDALVELPLDEAIEDSRWTAVSVDDAGFVAMSGAHDGRLTIYRSQDGHDWIVRDVVGDDPGEPSDIEHADFQQDRLVVYAESGAFSSKDGGVWESWDDEEQDRGYAIGSGYIQLPGFPREADPGGSHDTMWYQVDSGEPVAIDASEMAVTELRVNGGGGHHSLSSNTITMSQYQDEGAKLRDIWIITFDDVPA